VPVGAAGAGVELVMVIYGGTEVGEKTHLLLFMLAHKVAVDL